MDSNMQLSGNRIAILKKLCELRDEVININESEKLLNNKFKKMENKTEEKSKNGEECPICRIAEDILKFIESDDFKRLCIAKCCQLNDKFSYKLCQYENHKGMWCVTSNDEEVFNENHSINRYIKELTNKYSFKVLDFINNLGEGEYEKSLKDKVEGYYKSQLSNIIEDYNEEMKMKVTFRPSVPYESCSAYRKKQVDLVEGVDSLKEELKDKLEKLVYKIPDKFMSEGDLNKIQAYYISRFEKNEYTYDDDQGIMSIQEKNKCLIERKKKIINKYGTSLSPKYIFDEHALNCFIKYINNDNVDNIEKCVNLFEQREL